jgi:hypothetical protein
MPRLGRLPKTHHPETHQFDLFRPPGHEPRWQQIPEEARERVMSLMAQLLAEHARRDHREQPAGGRQDD